MPTLHESVDYTFRIICENDWADAHGGNVESPSGYCYKLTVPLDELDAFVAEFGSVDGFETDTFVRTVREAQHFIVRTDAYGFWFVDQYATERERDQQFAALMKAYIEWETE